MDECKNNKMSANMFAEKVSSTLSGCSDLFEDTDREQLIEKIVDRKDAIIARCGCLTTWTPVESTGRSPKDTYIVKHDESLNTIDWDSPNNIPMCPGTFDMIFEDAVKSLSCKKELYVSNRVIGADAKYALPVQTISDNALSILFSNNMFREVPENIDNSIYAKKPFTLIALPYDKLNADKYKGRLRDFAPGKTSNMAVVMDFDRRIGIVYGSAYMGSIKKLMFTVMNYILPASGILPLHCSANEGKKGDVALLLGLSGTGKTTLSADPSRALLGDDEHGWSEDGIANFENGCYAKLIDLDKDKEPEIYNAVMHEDEYKKHGAIVENAMIYPNGEFDLYDSRFTPNSRASYPLVYLSNIKSSSAGGHPKTILFLTADANGILPPVSKLDANRAMLWFLMGYTSKLAGTETGITDPVSTFSRFFGQPFMPRNPNDYAELLGDKMAKHGTNVYLVNTGWSGGPFGTGKRMDINITRAVVQAALEGELENVEYYEDELFHLAVPKTCPGVPDTILKPENTWEDKDAFAERAKKLANDFSNYFDKAYGEKNISDDIIRQCPGK